MNKPLKPPAVAMPTDLDPFLAALEREGFCGEVARDRASRTVNATDNSIYELVPQAVVLPREPDDLNRIMRAAAQSGIAITARGGGTGTNGQSLSEGVVVDCSRHLTAIESIDPDNLVAVVQPGVILDDFNRALAPHGLFFAPTVSTASRATLGGMAATDASGKGSRIYGRTSDHVREMDVVLSDGSDLHVADLDAAGLDAVCAREDRAGAVHRAVRDVVATEADEIARVFPVMNRGLTGYNLAEITGEDGSFRLRKVLAGSEGTLALTKRLTLRLTRKKAERALLIVAYDDILEALGDVDRLIGGDPVAVEFLDDKVVSLAQDDPIWNDISDVLANEGPRDVRGLNFVEIQADDPATIDATLAAYAALSARAPASVVSETVVRDARVIAQLWSLRAKGVGLLGRMDPQRQGTAFVEDAAVPPQNLAAFVAGFREILDGHGLAYGMFGHADVGCVHVRPALDMRRPEDAAAIRPVSDAVQALAARHGGLIWGEHGKGFRGEYVPKVFGPRLYAGLCRIKAAFDPDSLLNPGKIAATTPAMPLHAIDAVPMRGPRDATIVPAELDGYEKSVKCNGNGQCYNRDLDAVMCPSYKVSGDRRQSPKGRAALLREWLRIRSGADPQPAIAADSAAGPPLAEQLHAALATCFGCKACASECPVKVDIPMMRSRFFSSYYETHRRPLHHRILALMEPLAPAMRAAPALANSLMRASAPVLSRLGLVDLPAVRPARPATPRDAAAHDTRPAAVLMEDTFLATFDGRVVDACAALLDRLGYNVLRARARANGKAFHVLGMRAAFANAAEKAVAHARALGAGGVPVIVLEPAVRDLWRDEYAELGAGADDVVSLDAFLAAELAAGRLGPARADANAPAALFLHCTEASADPASRQRWATLLAHFGIETSVHSVGCCGMAGTFGHERANLALSRGAFAASWQQRVAAAPRVLATGFSCRSQVARFGDTTACHPAEHILANLG
ncbi:MAG: FAD-binding and (Fe-S)-binding domain-containing protein [Acuticoccus sp.]